MSLPWEQYSANEKIKTVVKNNSSKKACFVFFFILGFIFYASGGINIKNKFFPDSKNYCKMKVLEIENEIKSVKLKNDFTELEILLLNDKFSKKLMNNENIEIKKFSKFTGLQKYSGRGIILTVSDSVIEPKNNRNPNLGIVHNSDLLKIINELWDKKAEAISINGHRILANTEIICLGSTILINKEKIAPPFVIKAGGNPKKLSKILKSNNMLELKKRGINYLIEKKQMLEIPSSGTIVLTGEI